MFELTIYHFISLIIAIGGVQYWVISKIITNSNAITNLKTNDSKQEKKEEKAELKQDNLTDSINNIFLEIKEISLRLESVYTISDRLEKVEMKITNLEKDNIKHFAHCPLRDDDIQINKKK